MLNTAEIEQIIQEQINLEVKDYISKTLSSTDWVTSIENKIVQNVQSQILQKLSNIQVVPEIVESIKNSVSDLLEQGKIPGIDQYVNTVEVSQAVDLSVEKYINTLVESLGQDPNWVEKIERMINQAVVQRTVAKIASTDINTVIHERVDENLTTVHKKFMQNFSSNGINDRATCVQFTITDADTVVENQLVTKNLQVVGTALVKDLTVTGSINTDNRSWNILAEEISQRTLNKIQDKWKDQLVSQVKEEIRQHGIDFDSVTIQAKPLITGNTLSSAVTDTNIQKLGHLKNLQVKGEAHINDTVSVINHRVGINTSTPESALSVWDEEVSVIIGKHQSKQAFIGTSRDQALILGVNRQPQIEIDINGLTRVKKLQVGLHKISHDVQVPGWSGTRGDMVFNANPGSDRVFAWVCLGAHKWQTLKSAE
jgi:hypothetical protein